MHSMLYQGLNITIFSISALVLSVPRGIGYATLPMLLICLAMLYLNRGTEKRPLCANERRLLWGLSALPIAIALSMLLHGDWTWAHFDKPARFLFAIPVYLAIRQLGCSRQFFYLGLMVGAIAAGSLGFYQKYILHWPVAEGFTHKIPFGDISLMLGFLSLTCCIQREGSNSPKRWLIALAIIAFGFGLLGSLTSGTRGGWIAIPLLLWLVFTEIVKNRAIRWGLYSACVAGLVTIYLNNNLVQSKIDIAVDNTARYFENGEIKGSAGTRLEMWKAAWLMFQEAPLRGVGKEGYPERLAQLIEEERVGGIVHSHAHNEFMNLLAELGIIGGLSLIALYALLLRFFFVYRNVDRQLSTAGLLLGFGYIDFSLTQAMFEHNISISFLAFYAAILAGMLSYARRPKADTVGQESMPLAARPA